MDSPCIKQTVCKVLKIFQYGKYLVAYVLNMQKSHQNDVVVMDSIKLLTNRLLYKLSSYGVYVNTLGWIGSFLSGTSGRS